MNVLFEAIARGLGDDVATAARGGGAHENTPVSHPDSAVVPSPSAAEAAASAAHVQPTRDLFVIQEQRAPRSLDGRSVSLPATAQLILCDNECIKARHAADAHAGANAILFRPGRMFESGDRSSARRAYDVCHVFENLGLLRRARYKNLKGYFWLGLEHIPQFMQRHYGSGKFASPEANSSSVTPARTLKKAQKVAPREDASFVIDPKHTPTLSLLTRAYLSSIFARNEIGVFLSCKNIVSRIMADRVPVTPSKKVVKSFLSPPELSRLTLRQVQRRIYDVLGVLEIAGVVSKRRKPKAYSVCPEAVTGLAHVSGTQFAASTLAMIEKHSKSAVFPKRKVSAKKRKTVKPAKPPKREKPKRKKSLRKTPASGCGATNAGGAAKRRRPGEERTLDSSTSSMRMPSGVEENSAVWPSLYHSSPSRVSINPYKQSLREDGMQGRSR